MYDQSIALQEVNKDVWPKCCIAKVNNDVWPKYWITKVNKVLYYKSKQRCYGQSIVLQK